MKISVIIPAYNAEKYLSETISSVQSQTYDDWELVIVNDGSKDNTATLAEGIAAQDLRVRVVHQKNAGLSGARNSGLAVASAESEYVLFLDADDVLEPYSLNTLSAMLAANHAASAAHGLARYINGDSMPARLNEAEEFGRTRYSVRAGRLLTHPVEDATNFSMLAYRNTVLTPGMVLLRRTALEKAGSFDIAMSPTADWDMWLRITRAGSNASYGCCCFKLSPS